MNLPDAVFTPLTTLSSLPRKRKRTITLAIDYAVLTVVCLFSAGMLWELSAVSFLVTATVLLHPVATIFLASLLGTYKEHVRYSSDTSALILAISLVTVAFLGCIALVVLGTPGSLIFTVLSTGLSFTALALIRIAFRVLIKKRTIRRHMRVLIYGAGSAGRQLTQALLFNDEYETVAIVDDDTQLVGQVICGVKVRSSECVSDLIESLNIGKILLAIPSASSPLRKKILRRLENQKVEIQTIPGMNDIIEGRMAVDNLRSVSVDDLLGREPVKAVDKLISNNISDKNVLVTGAGGSIGSEICRQIIKQSPKCLVLYELSEFGLYAIHAELTKQLEEMDVKVELKPLLGTVQNKHRMLEAMKAFGIHTVYHAAAYKHVPMVEYNVVEGVRNNVFGTWHAAEAAIDAGVERFVLISTDKAVRPTNVMGTTKRCAELICQGLAARQQDTTITMVRFGNVLGSSGSVVPLFQKQIEAGGPITVTHRDITRYFMTIPEAAQLVIQAGAMAKGGEVYVLDMGEPVKIFDLAQHMVRLSGLSVKDENNLDGDIEIKFSGLRPGEKLYEELLIGDNAAGTSHPRINTALESHLSWKETVLMIEALDDACKYYRHEDIRRLLLSAPTGFAPTDDIGDLVWLASKKQGPNNIVSL